MESFQRRPMWYDTSVFWSITWCVHTVYSGHLEWLVGRYLVVVRYPMVDCPRWVYQSCWKMEREWKNQTMLLALNMCKRNYNYIKKPHLQSYSYRHCICVSLPHCTATRLSWSSVGTATQTCDQRSLNFTMRSASPSPTWRATWSSPPSPSP